MAKKARRRRVKPCGEHFVIAQLDNKTVLAGWCITIPSAKLAQRVRKFVPPPGSDIIALPYAFTSCGEQPFALLLGGTLQGRL